jgi:hypothetical protein
MSQKFLILAKMDNVWWVFDFVIDPWLCVFKKNQNKKTTNSRYLEKSKLQNH